MKELILIKTDIGSMVGIIEESMIGSLTYYRATMLDGDGKILIIEKDRDLCIKKLTKSFNDHINFWLIKELSLIEKE